MTKATEASDSTEEAEEKEKVKLSVTGALAKDNGDSIREDYLNEELSNYIGVRNIDYELNGTGPFVIKYCSSEREYTVSTAGEVSEGIVYTSSDIARDFSKFFGKTVINYDCINKSAVNDWQILYADNENIYLIAKNIISYEYVPNSKNYSVAHIGDYQIYFGSVEDDYLGSQSITDSRIRKWNNYVTAYPECTNSNIKNCAYLLDTNIWSVFAGEKAEYAIGAPTIELFSTAYNKVNDIKIEYEITNQAGYSVKTTNESYGKLANINNTANILGSNQWWLATPSISNGPCIMQIEGYANRISYQNFTYTPSSQPGIRPVVCLKSTTKLEEIDENTYSVVL